MGGLKIAKPRGDSPLSPVPSPQPPARRELYRDLDSLPERFHHGAVAIGNFDGVHQGHAADC